MLNMMLCALACAYISLQIRYVGEILTKDEFDKRKELYGIFDVPHFYFMQLDKDHIIDASQKGGKGKKDKKTLLSYIFYFILF